MFGLQKHLIPENEIKFPQGSNTCTAPQASAISIVATPDKHRGAPPEDDVEKIIFIEASLNVTVMVQFVLLSQVNSAAALESPDFMKKTSIRIKTLDFILTSLMTQGLN